MRKLHELQHNFEQTLLKDVSGDLRNGLIEEGLTAAERLNIHRNNVLISLSAALARNFPVVCRLVGQAFFDQMARAFIRQRPLHTPLMMNFGEGFADFMETYEPAVHLVYLPDVARLENIWTVTFNGPDGNSFDPATLHAVNPQDMAYLKVDFLANLALMTSPYPLWDIWRANRQYPLADEVIQLDKGGCFLALYRPELDVEILSLSENAYYFLKILMAGKTLGQAVEEIAQQQADFDLQASLQKIIHSGMVTGFEIMN